MYALNSQYESNRSQHNLPVVGAQEPSFTMGAHASLHPLNVGVESFSMCHVFRMFATAQDDPGRLVHLSWSTAHCTYVLSVVFNTTTNEANWRLTINRPGISDAVLQRKTRNLTEVYHSVLALGSGAQIQKPSLKVSAS